MKNNFKISFLLAASLMIILSSCGKTELVAPNGNTAGNVFDGDEKSFLLDSDKGDPTGTSYSSNRGGELDPIDPNGNGGNTGNDDGGKPDPNGGSFIGDDDDDSNLGNNEGKSLEISNQSDSGSIEAGRVK